MKKLVFPFALTGSLIAAYALAESPPPSCEELIERGHEISEAVSLGVPRQQMLESARTPEGARLINRVYDEAWPVYSARSMAKRLCQQVTTG